jgi:hypothetical protein
MLIVADYCNKIRTSGAMSRKKRKKNRAGYSLPGAGVV